jgi:hypothetical protein
MTTLPGTYMPNRPAEHRVTVLDTPEELLWYHLDGGILEDAEGVVTLASPSGAVRVPLKGLYRIQRLENGVPEAGPGQLMTKEMFASEYSEHAAPYFEFGVKFLPRRNDIVVHGSYEAAVAALDGLPVLKASGEYSIARRLVHEPGDWELVPQGDAAP